MKITWNLFQNCVKIWAQKSAPYWFQEQRFFIHQKFVKLGTNKRKRRETTLTFDFSNKK
jgi:hypothetical protein